jgi:hypothetical protein
MRSKSPQSALDNTKDTARYTCFTRTWWKPNPSWPDGREPGVGAKRVQVRNLSYREAMAYCGEWNAKHPPGPMSLKCEFEQQ